MWLAKFFDKRNCGWSAQFYTFSITCATNILAKGSLALKMLLSD